MSGGGAGLEHGGVSGRDGRLRLRDRRLEAGPIESDQRLSGRHLIAFLDHDLGHDAATARRRKLCMPDRHGTDISRHDVRLGDRWQRR